MTNSLKRDKIQTINPDGTTQAADQGRGEPPKEGTHQRKIIFLDKLTET